MRKGVQEKRLNVYPVPAVTRIGARTPTTSHRARVMPELLTENRLFCHIFYCAYHIHLTYYKINIIFFIINIIFLFFQFIFHFILWVAALLPSLGNCQKTF